MITIRSLFKSGTTATKKEEKRELKISVNLEYEIA